MLSISTPGINVKIHTYIHTHTYVCIISDKAMCPTIDYLHECILCNVWGIAADNLINIIKWIIKLVIVKWNKGIIS